jgi:hypothetical protein
MPKTTTKKVATKKAAKKAGNPSLKTLPPIIKIWYNGEQHVQKALFEARAKTLKVEADQVRDMFRAHASGQEDFDAEGDSKLQKAWDAIGKDWKNHVKAKADKEKAAIEAKAASEKAKSTAIAIMAKAEEEVGGTELVVSLTSKIEGLVSEKLSEDGFIYNKGKFSLGDGVEVTQEAIAHGFATLSSFASGGETLKDSACIAEAKFALFVRDELEQEWENLYSERTNDLFRIRKYMKVLESANEVIIQDPASKKPKEITVSEYLDRGEMPFSTARIVFETRFDEDEEKNNEEKAKAIQNIISTAKAQGGKVPQVQARNIIADMRGGQGSKKQLGFIYIHVLDTGEFSICGTEKEEPLFSKTADIVIARGSGKYVDNNATDQTTTDILEPTEKIRKHCASLMQEKGEEEKPEPKAKKKVSKVAEPEPEEEEVEEEEDVEVPIEDWDLETLGDVADSTEHSEAEAAAAELTSRAEVAGVDPNEYETWADVAAALGEETEEVEEDGDEEEEEGEDWEE